MDYARYEAILAAGNKLIEIIASAKARARVRPLCARVRNPISSGVQSLPPRPRWRREILRRDSLAW
jgi:hypothetical protein